MDDTLTFHYAPQTRALSVRTLLEETGIPHKLHILNMRAGEQRQPDYLAINPMGKVPAIEHKGELVTEQGAIFIYLNDAFPEKSMAPSIGDPLRGPYLRWITYYGSVFEPAIVDKALKREPGLPAMMPYGDYDTMLKTLVDQLSRGKYILGDTFTAADLLWGSALMWAVKWELVPDLGVLRAYADAFENRPIVQKLKAEEAELAAKHERIARERAA
jgi:glutathione S-transferase